MSASRSTARSNSGASSAGDGSGLRLLLSHAGRWLLTLVGGVLIGAGLVLHGQVALAHHLRQEVDRTFFLWRAVGEATIFLQGGDVRLAFAMRDVPANVLRESDLAAWTLVAVGTLMALTAPLLPFPHRTQPLRTVARGGGRTSPPAGKPPAKKAPAQSASTQNTPTSGRQKAGARP